MSRNIRKFVIHHAAVDQPDMQKVISSFNRTHKQKFHPRPNEYGLHIAYHYVIGMDGTIQKTRPLNEIGYHASNYNVNAESIGICFVGNFDKIEPSILQYRACAAIIMELNPSRKCTLHEHNEFASYKTCPGKKFDMNILRFYLDPKNYHIYNELPIPKNIFKLDNKIFEYTQTDNNCFLYEAIGVFADNFNYDFTKKECLEIEVLAGKMGVNVGIGGSNPEAFTVVRERWNINKDIKAVTYVFDMSLKKNIARFTNGYSIGIQMGIDKKYAADKTDGVLDDLHPGKNGHSARIRYNGEYMQGIDNYKYRNGNKFKIKQFSKRLGKEISKIGMTAVPEMLL